MSAHAAKRPLLGISGFGTGAADHYERLARSGHRTDDLLRMGGVHMIVGALVALGMMALVPPTAVIGNAGWAVAAASVAGALAAGLFMVRTGRPSPTLHLGLLGLAVVLITLLVWLAGLVDVPFAVLYLLAAQHVAIHPPRRMLVLMGAIGLSILVPFLDPALDESTAAFALMLLGIEVTVMTGVLYRLGLLYGDEAISRAESARVRAEAQLARREAESAREAARALRELDAAKDGFVSTVSHELRTPLTSVKGYLEAILAGEAGELNSEQREYAEIVYRNSTRLQELVDDLLVLSRVDAGELVLSLEHFDLVESLRRVREELGPRAAERGLMLLLDAPKEIMLTADRRRVEQMVSNLVSNAIKYGGGGEEVRIRAFSHGGEAAVEVIDQGVGIPAAELLQIGERFFRATTAGDEPGSGLGLAITREIVQRHGGTLDVDSAEGIGSSFRVRLPLSE